MLQILEPRRLAQLLFATSLGMSLQAGNWELGGTFGVSQESEGTISAIGSYPTMPYTIVNNKFTGLWWQGGLSAGYEVLHRGSWGLWVQGHYAEGLSHPALYHSGENVSVGSTISETFNGSASYKSTTFGIAITRTFLVGEFGLGIGSRSHDLSVEGPRQNRVNGIFTYDHYTASYSARDVLVSLSFTMTQDQGRFRSFQRVSFGTGFGASLPTLNPGPEDWKMREAYLARILPNKGMTLVLGVRL